MTPNEYAILRMLAAKDCITVREVAQHMRKSLGYSKYLCAGMVNAGLLAECTADPDRKPVHAYRLTPKSRAVLADLYRGMESNMRRRAARFERVAAIVEDRADRLGEMAFSLDEPNEGETGAVQPLSHQGAQV